MLTQCRLHGACVFQQIHQRIGAHIGRNGQWHQQQPFHPLGPQEFISTDEPCGTRSQNHRSHAHRHHQGQRGANIAWQRRRQQMRPDVLGREKGQIYDRKNGNDHKDGNAQRTNAPDPTNRDLWNIAWYAAVALSDHNLSFSNWGIHNSFWRYIHMGKPIHKKAN